MPEQQRTATFISPWEGFLPRHSLVMTRPAAYVAAPIGCGHPALKGEGDSQAQLVFVGEGTADAAAEELLEKMIKAIGFSKDQVFLFRLNDCENCNSTLLGTLRAKVFVALGDPATRTLVGSEIPRGRFHAFQGAKLMPTFHPAQLLQNPGSKKDAWEDLKQVAAELGLKTK